MKDKKNKGSRHQSNINQGRRQLLKAGATIGAVSAMSALAMPGFSWASQSKRGGTIRVGVADGNTTDSLDPGLWAESFTMIAFSGAIYNNLVEIDENGTLIPELAENWESSPDASVWTFKLRKGVEFHNGKTLDANDVVATFNHHRKEDSKSAAKGLLLDLVEIKAQDSQTVVFKLKSGNADFPFVVSDFHLAILQAKEGQADWQSGIGTGGYRLKSWQPGVRASLERQSNYWKAGRAHFDAAEIIVVTDDAARMNALMTGEVDVINKVNLKTIHLMQRNPNIVIEEVTGTQHYTFPMQTQVSPFADNNVRMALKHAIDRDVMVKTILKGHGQAGNDHPISPANRFFNKELAVRAYDPDKAKFYLRKAGMEKLNIQFHTSEAAFSGATDAAVLFKEQAAKAGINIDVAREPADGYWSNVWNKKPFVMSYFFGRPTEDAMFSLAYTKKAPWNESQWDHDGFNKLLVAARAELNDDKRREMYYEMQRLCRDEGGTIIPMFANYVAARNKTVTNSGTVGSNGELDGLRVIERWWKA
jgi:peptide/nickel transport system substrate-binding protein